MAQEPKKTHVERKSPQISLARLADYMAASEQAKRTIARTCKYRAIARVIQHNDAKAVIANWLRTDAPRIALLKEKLEAMKARIFEDNFQAEVNDHNCDYVKRFISISDSVDFSQYELARPTKFASLIVRGCPVSVQVDVLTSRTDRRNKTKIGAMMFRYSKGKELSEDVAQHQSAFMFEYLRQHPYEKSAEAEKKLCITLDCYSGTEHVAPGNANYLFKEMAAACENLVERWPAIKPPAGAVF